ncbi:MAG TPA: alcohol dehydrogenase catalytic domain-containing protein, partial [Planctomycetota bacterium]|nr:alcohol dehydrogenase catalytic domain-containing protein [Planctomycetota bacterium]
MFAIRPSRTGGPEVLVLAEYPTPTPGPDDVLVRTEAIGVNFIDVYHRRGLYPQPLPIPLGMEGVGIIEQVGAAVTTLRVGERVGWCGASGFYATHVVMPAVKA